VKKRYKCICCGYFTLVGAMKEDVAWDICPVCFWENDVSEENPNVYSGANHMTLAQGRDNYRTYSTCDLKSVASVRPPIAEEMPVNNGEKGQQSPPR
jgi:hypothetical protein